MIIRNCPHCGRAVDSITAVRGDTAVPSDGAVSICTSCAKPSIFEGEGLRLPTEQEQQELDADEELQQVLQTGQMLRELRDLAEEDGGLAIGVDLDTGETRVLNDETPTQTLPPILQSLVATALQRVKTKLLTEMITRYVTPEVAHHVLSSYGNEEATMPSLATSTLISLIKVANQSDEHILYHLNEVEDFRGYVLAVTVMAEDAETGGVDESGLKMLEIMAGLRDGDLPSFLREGK